MDQTFEHWAITGLEPFDGEKILSFLTTQSTCSSAAEKLSHIIFCASLDTPCLWGGDGQVPVLGILSADGPEIVPRIMIRSANPETDASLELTGLEAVRALAGLWSLFPGAPCLRLEPLKQAFVRAGDLLGPLCLAWLLEVDQQADWNSGLQVSWQDLSDPKDDEIFEDRADGPLNETQPRICAQKS